MMKMTWTIRVSSVAAPSHGASDMRGRQHKMLRLQEEGYFLSRSDEFVSSNRPIMLRLKIDFGNR